MATHKRLMNIARRMDAGDLFCFKGTQGEAPWISRDDVLGLEALGLRIQEDHGLHEAHFAYPLHEHEFHERLQCIQCSFVR